MKTTYEKYCDLGIDGSLISLETAQDIFPYFCYPVNARAIGTEGSILYCFIESLVKTAIIGQIDSAAQSQTVLSDSYYHITEKNKEKIINWIFEYTEKNIDDPMIIFLGFNLLLKLKWGELFVRYIGLYDELIKKEFDDDYIEHYGISQFL